MIWNTFRWEMLPRQGNKKNRYSKTDVLLEASWVQGAFFVPNPDRV